MCANNMAPTVAELKATVCFTDLDKVDVLMVVWF